MKFSEPMKTALVVGLLALVILASRIPGVSPPETGVLFNVDELEMTLSVLDRFLGVPSTSLAWPGASLQLLSMPLLLVHYMVGSTYPISQEGFVGYLAHSYREPWQAVALVRGTVAVVSSLGLALLYMPLLGMTRSKLASLVGVVLLATVPQMWLHSHMAMGDAFSIGCACAAMACLCRHGQGSFSSVAVAGVLMGLAVAAKFPSALLLPLLLGVIVTHVRRPARGIAVFGLFLGLGFLVACPYVWTDPIRLAKSVLGNTSRVGITLGLWAIGERITRIVSLPVTLLAILGCWKLLRQRRWGVLGGAVISLSLVVAIVGRLGAVYDRYFLPAVVVLGILGCLGLAVVGSVGGLFPPRYALAARIGLVGLIGGYSSFYSARLHYFSLREVRAEARQTAGLMSRLSSANLDRPIAIPAELLPNAAKFMSSKSLQGLAEHAATAPPAATVGRFAATRGLSHDLVSVLGSSLTEDEQAYGARLRAMAYPPSRTGIDFVLWGSESAAGRFGYLSEQEMLSAFGRGDLDMIVVATPAERDARPGFDRYGRYEVLTRPESNGASK